MRQLRGRLAAYLNTFVGRAMTGQGLTEYALILTLVVILAIVALLFIGSDIANLLSGEGQSV